MEVPKKIHLMLLCYALGSMAPSMVTLGSELSSTPGVESESTRSSKKLTFPISLSSNAPVGNLFTMQSNAILNGNGHVTGSTVTTMMSPIGAPCGGVYMILTGEDGSRLGAFKMAATGNTLMPFCVHGVLTSPNDPHIRTDPWSGEIPEEVINKAASAELIHACLSNCSAKKFLKER